MILSSFAVLSRPLAALALVMGLGSVHGSGRSTPLEGLRELVIIDAGVSDADKLAESVRPGVEVLMLDNQRDALTQIIAGLAHHRNLTVAHVISHAEPGAMILGGQRVNEAFFTRSDVVAAINEALGADGELRLYGCRLAAGDVGSAFYGAVSAAIRGKVFASTDYTGDSALGGNWELEAGDSARAGAHPFEKEFKYRGLLPPVVTHFNPTVIYTRPGGSNSYWKYDTYTDAALGVPSPLVITEVSFHTDTVANRGTIQYAATIAGPWTTLNCPVGTIGPFVSPAGKVFRFVDGAPADTTTNPSGGINFSLQGNGSSFFKTHFFTPDNPPTDVFTLTQDYWGGTSAGDVLAALRRTDTGAPFSYGGAYTIDSQSVANLFSITDETLVKSSGALPAVGQAATVTLRYRDYFQLDDSGVPIAGQGVTRTMTMVRRSNPTGLSSDVVANTYTSDAQNAPSVAALSDGSYVVVWRSTGQGGETTSFGGIYGQKFTAAGVKSGSEFAISPAGNGVTENAPSVAGLASGRFVVVYQQSNADTDVVFRIVEANGTLGAETQAPSTANGTQNSAWVTKLSDDNFAITWVGPNGGDTGDVWVRKFNSSNGSAVGGSELVVNTTQANTQSAASIAGLSNGNYAVSWRDSLTSGDAYCQVMSASAKVGSQITVSSNANGTNNPRVAALSGGGFVVVYSETGHTEGAVVDSTTQSNIYGRRYDNAGALQGSEFLVSGGTQSSQTVPTVSGLSGGGFVAGWSSNTDTDGTGGVFARRFDATGTAIEYDFQMSERRIDTQSAATVAGLLTNSVGMAWSDGTLDGTANSGVGSRSLTGSAPVPPVVTNVTSTSGNASYKVGDVIPVTVTFDAAVTVTGTPQLTLETGTTDRVVNYSSGSGSTTLTFNYIVQSGDTSADLDYTSASALALNGGTIRDAALNSATLTLASPGAAGSLGANNAIMIDTTPPTVASVTSSTANGSYTTSATISIQVNFSEAVTVTGTPQLTLETGATDRTINYATGSGSSTLTFNYTVQAGDTSADLDYLSTSALALNGGTIRDAALNNATLTLASPGAAGSLGANKALVLDTTAPTVINVASTSGGNFTTGAVIPITVLFTKSVNVTGTPQLTLETGATDRTINYASGSNSTTLTFTYTVQAGDTASDLDYVSIGALTLNGGTIRDVATNNATLTLPLPGDSGSLGANNAIVIDTTLPTVTNVTSTAANGTFVGGNVISITVIFSEAVTVTGTPQLTLETGATDRVVNYTSGSGSNTLTFNYTVQAGDTSSDLDYISTGALALNGGTIRDAALNNATLTLASPGAASSLGANKAIVLDTSLPLVTSPTVTNILTDSAILGGNVTSSGSSPVTARGVVYAKTSDDSSPQIGELNVTSLTTTGTTGVFTVNATGLTLNTGYSFSAYATSAAGTTYTSPVSTFTTAPGAPIISAPTTTNLTATTLTHGANVTSDGGMAVTERGVVYSLTSANPDPLIGGGATVTKLTTTGTTGVFTVDLTGITESTGYSMKAYATNSIGTSYTAVTTTATPSASAAFTNVTDTTQSDFQAGAGTNIDRATGPGDVILADAPADQSNLAGTSTGTGFGTTTWTGQTFIPAVSGLLTKVEAEVFGNGVTAPFPNLVMSVRATSGGLPTGADLATATLPSVTDGSATTYAFIFGTPANLTAGTQYALILRPSFAPNGAGYFWIRSSPSTYANGSRVLSANSGGAWTADTTRDYNFTTYIGSGVGYPASGTFTSVVKDSGIAGNGTVWATLARTATTPVGTEIKFQVAASTAPAGPFNFVGPNGMADTYFTDSASSLSQFNGNRYLQYKAFLNSSDPSATPKLSDVTLAYSDVGVSVAVSPASVSEDGATNLTYTFTRTGETTNPLTVNFSVDGTGVFGMDYGQTGAATFSTTTGTVTIGAGSTTATVTLDPTADMTREPNETAILTVTAAAGYGVNAPSAATGTINNDDFEADLAITKTDGVTTATPGGSVTYTITATNVGPDPVVGATVADTFPGILTASWTGVGAGGGTCTASGAGNINDTVNLPVGGAVTYTVSATISASATGFLVNTASISTPVGVTDTNLANNSATDTDTLTPQADLSITVTDGVTTATPGGTVTYTITASNAGPSNAPGATVADTFPAILTPVNWTGVGAGGGTATPSGSGNINDTVTLPAGGSVTYTVTAAINSLATGSLVNTATVTAPGGVTDPNSGNDSATDTDTLTPSADLAITITDSPDPVIAGNSLTYTITTTNTGPSTATNVNVSGTAPSGTSLVSATATSGTGFIGGGSYGHSIGFLPPGGSSVLTLTVNVGSGVLSGTTLSNTASLTSDTTDPVPGNNSATATTTVAAQADLAITVTDGVTTATPGGTVTYTITASNSGPSNVTGATVADTFPASLTGVTWTASSTVGAAATPSGVGNINDTVTLPVGESVTYTVTATIATTASGSLVNTATITAPIGVTDPTPGNNSATDTDTLGNVVSIATTDADADENTAGAGTWRVTRNGTSGALTVQLQLGLSSSASIADWSQSGGTFASLAPGSAGTIVIPAGVGFVDITLTPLADLHAEAAETVQLDVIADASYTPISPTSATVTIGANDFVVINSNDAGEGSLRQAVENANNFSTDDVITFATPQNVVLTTGELLIQASGTLSILGGSTTSISGNNASRVFQTQAGSNLTLRGLGITGGNAGVTPGSNGGGILNAGTLTVISSTLWGNSAAAEETTSLGGGIFNEGGTIYVFNSTLSNNTANGYGAAVYSRNGSLYLYNSTISGNTTAVTGGGLYNDEGVLEAYGITVSANTASGAGGGIRSFAGTTRLYNSIVAGNITTSNPGSAPTDLSMSVGSGAVLIGSNNLIGVDTGHSLANGVDGNQVGTNASPLNALLGPLANNGGPTFTHAPQDGSPVVNAGDNAFLPVDAFDVDGNSNTAELLSVDQRGATFPRVIGSIVDIGAYEAFAFRPAITASTTDEDTQSASGLVVTPNTADGGLTTHFKITNIQNGTLYQNDGTTGIAAGTFLTLAEGAAGLKFTPALNLNSGNTATFGFDAQATVDGTDAGLRTGLASAAVTVTAVNDGPTVVAPGLADQTMTVGDTRSVALPAAFADVDLDTLTYTVQTNSDSAKATAVINGTNVALAALASGVTNVTIQANDGNMGTVTDTFQVAVGTVNPTPSPIPPAPPGGYPVSGQTGTFDIVVPVTNTTAFPINGFRLFVDISAYPSLRLYNASSAPGVSPAFIDHPFPVAVGAVVNVKLMFYTSTRVFPNPFNPVLSIVSLPVSQLPGAVGPGVPATIRATSAGQILLEWTSIPGSWYRVQYSDDMTNWYISTVPVQAASNRTQWVDSGAPFTHSPPVGARFYRVNSIPAPSPAPPP